MPGFATENPDYQPAMRLITAITNANPAAVTTSFDHDYLAGLIVRIYIPDLFGMRQADQLVGEIIEVTGSDSFTININTSSFDVFTVPNPEPWYAFEFPMVVPIGEINESLAQATRNVL